MWGEQSHTRFLVGRTQEILLFSWARQGSSKLQQATVPVSPEKWQGLGYVVLASSPPHQPGGTPESWCHSLHHMSWTLFGHRGDGVSIPTALSCSPGILSPYLPLLLDEQHTHSVQSFPTFLCQNHTTQKSLQGHAESRSRHSYFCHTHDVHKQKINKDPKSYSILKYTVQEVPRVLIKWGSSICYRDSPVHYPISTYTAGRYSMLKDYWKQPATLRKPKSQNLQTMNIATTMV